MKRLKETGEDTSMGARIAAREDDLNRREALYQKVKAEADSAFEDNQMLIGETIHNTIQFSN